MNTTFTAVIEVIVAPNGDTRVETRGFTGPTCREASRLIEQALGKAVSERLTAEFHHVDSVEDSKVQRC